jgi:hypothetical protein
MCTVITRPAAARLDREPALRRAAQLLHGAGPRFVGHFICELIDDLGLPSAELDRLLNWADGLDKIDLAYRNQWPQQPAVLVPPGDPS